MKINLKKKKLKELKKTYPVNLEQEQLVYINGGGASHHGTTSWLPNPDTKPPHITN